MRLKPDRVLTFSLIVIYQRHFKIRHPIVSMAVDLCMADKLISMSLTLMQGHSGMAEGKTSALNRLSLQLSKQEALFS